MLIFNRVSSRNFLASGDTPIEIILDAAPSTLVIGKNGASKSSSLLDAICFGLFDRAYRKINKPLIINSINGKNCRVEVDFTIGIKKYRIIRGLKPNIFEIYVDGVLLNQDSHTRDYQKVLEQSILKCNFKAFTQVVVIGSASHVPFMLLPTGHRREIIEDLLDINIFTQMNNLLKTHNAKIKEELSNIAHQIDILTEKKALQAKHITSIRAIYAQNEAESDKLVADMTSQIAALQERNDVLSAQISEHLDTMTANLAASQEKRQNLLSFQKQIQSNIQRLVKEAKFYEDNSSCPTCAQIIPVELKTHKHEVARTQAKELKTGLDKLANELLANQSRIDADQEALAAITSSRNEHRSNAATIKNLNRQIRSILDSARANPEDLSNAENSLLEIVEGISLVSQSSSHWQEERTYNEVIGEMLKDSGIKTRIIRQYLPMMNKLINQYLQIFDLFISFQLDETFNETVRSRHRDNFVYSSFSEGEKTKLDLAILFAWRQIARMKNSISTNLLILDEIMDSSLDSDGTESLFSILNSLEQGTNCIVISHKHEALLGKFNRTLQFEKINDFASVKELF